MSVLTSAAALGATTTLGPTDLSTGGLSSFSAPWSSTLLNHSSPSSLTAATAPGTITTWRFAGAGAGHVQLFIVQPAATPNGFTAVAASAVETVGPGLNTFSTALPIAPGQLPVLWLGANTAVYARPDAAWPEYASLATPTVGATDTYSVGPANQVLYNADEEVADAVGNAPAPPPAPVVAALSAPSGSTAGGETLTISGESFSSGSTVTFGDVAATSVTVDRFDQLTVVAPPHAEGAVDVRVTTPGGTSAVVDADAYTYVAPPTPPVVASSSTASTTAPAKHPTVKQAPKKKAPKKHTTKKHTKTKKTHAKAKHR